MAGVKLVGLLFVLFSVVSCSAFNPDRCKLIDQTKPGALPSNHTNYLFRGDLPLDDNGDFAWEQMNATFHDIVPTMDQHYVMIDLSFLNKFELLDEEAEKRYFRQNPQHGEYINWPIWGNAMMPDFFDESQRTQMSIDLPNWQHDDLPSKIPELNSMLYTDYNVTTVIYIHCEAGMDRTGEISGSYYIRYLGWSFEDALYYDDHAIEDRNIHVASRNGFQWYCYYLDNTQQVANNCSLPAFDNCGYIEKKCNTTTN